MKKKNFIALIIFLIIGIIFLFCDFTLANKNTDLFDDILKKTNSKTTEYGITAVITTDENEEKICNDILKKLNFFQENNKKLLNNGKICCTEFTKGNVNGYIETMKYENHNVITVNMVERNNKNGLNEMKSKLQKCVEDENVTAKYFQYLRAQISDNDINKANNEVLKILKGYGASNINTITLENGYTSTAYTGTYDAMQSNGKLMDFNYAVCRYHSNSYIILGTPEIIITY